MRRQLVHYGLVIAYVGLPLTFALLMGGEILGLASTSADLLGGLTLNVLLSAGAALLSFPLGVMLALARRSEMPVFRYLAAVYIEFWRGVPLITVLFTALILLPMFLSSSISLGTFPRAFLALVVVYAAYMAEVIRGGLQAVPEGQLEAARSLGLGYWRCHVLVILPQAIRAVLPVIVNTIIELLKDSTLVYMIGLFDVLGVLSLALRETQWIGLSTEAYIFVAIVYFAMSRVISWAGGLLERRSTA
jgi:general L-amino acid transport system permease protein